MATSYFDMKGRGWLSTVRRPVVMDPESQLIDPKIWCRRCCQELILVHLLDGTVVEGVAGDDRESNSKWGAPLWCSFSAHECAS